MINAFDVRFNLNFHYPAEEVKALLASYERIHNERILRLNDSRRALYGKRVVFVGDSITSDNLGYRTTVTRAAHLIACDTSLSGGRSSDILESAVKAIAESAPDIVSIMIGANDSPLLGEPPKHGLDLSDYAENLRNIVAAADAAKAKVLLFEITPVHESRFAEHYRGRKKYQTNENIGKYNAVLAEIAAEYGALLLKNDWLGDEADFEPDGIHLSETAQGEFAARWLDAAAKAI